MMLPVHPQKYSYFHIIPLQYFRMPDKGENVRQKKQFRFELSRDLLIFYCGLYKINFKKKQISGLGKWLNPSRSHREDRRFEPGNHYYFVFSSFEGCA